MNTGKDALLKLDSPRVWRTYLGGKELDELHGNLNGEDGHFPEEWIMSVVTARNPGREKVLQEGMSRIDDADGKTLKECLESDPERFLGKEHVKQFGAQPGALVKLIDAAERLTVQVHPDREMAEKLFGTAFGKTECWHILQGRSVQNETPCIYLGFKEGITREKWKKLFDEQDIQGMLDSMHCFEVHPGDTILIEGGVPHAIGAGCFLVEIQEPTDYTIRVEKSTPSGFLVAEEACHQGLGFEKMFDCFHYEGFSYEKTRQKWFLDEKELVKTEAGRNTKLVNYEDTRFFAMNRLEIFTQMMIKPERFCALYVLKGCGKILAMGHTEIKMEMEVKAPQQIFVPADTEKLKFVAENGQALEVLQFFGPKV